MRIQQWICIAPLRLRSLFRRRRVEQELDDELQFHLERQVHEAVTNGEDAAEARRRALLEFEGLEKCKEECRDMRHTNGIETLIRDLAYAARVLRKSPIFAVTAAVTLALGIGAATAAFSVTNTVLLRPLPYRHANRLALLLWENRAANIRSFLYSNADFADLQAGTRSIFEEMCGVASFRAFVPREDGSAEQLSRAMVTTNFFRLMGARIAFGRDFTDADSRPQPAEAGVLIPSGSAAILSYEYWQRRYGGSTAILGHEMAGAGQRGPRIVGVLAPGFKLYFPPGARIDAVPDYWVANNIGYDSAHRNLLTIGAIGRLKSGITFGQAQTRLDAVAPEFRKNSFDRAAAIRLQPMREYLVEGVRPALLMLMGAVLFLLVIACANVANLLLVRASLRERELALRAALGGGWWRLVRQMLAESLLLSGIGTLAGLCFAWVAIRVFVHVAPANLPRIESVAIDWRVLVFASLTGIASVALFGLVPAFRAATPDLIHVLRASGQTGGLSAGRMLRDSVVVVEVALSFVLLVGAGLMFRSFLELRRMDAGYDPRNVLTFFVNREWPLPKQEGRLELLSQIQTRLRALPGIEDASAALILPLAGGQFSKGGAPPRPQPAPPRATSEGADFQQVMPRYFETLRTHVVAGRTFQDADNTPGHKVVVIDEALAGRALPNETAVGHRIHLPDPANPWAEVIGVVANQRLFSVSDPSRGTIFFPDGFWGIGVSRYWMVRTSADPAQYVPAVRSELAKIDNQLVISKLRPMEAVVADDQANARLSLLLIGVFAGISAILAGVGIYGVLASAVRQRTAEIGVRMALGAAPASVFKLVAGHGMRLAVAGIAAGLLAALGLTRLMTSMLVEVRPADPATFVGIIAVFLIIASVASWAPAVRAAGLDANAALREE